MSVSIREVAAAAGVSVGTVSNVLNRPEAVRAETVERVQAAISRLGYVPNAAARQLRVGRSGSIGLIVLDVANPFFTDVARGAEREADEAHLSVMLANSGESVEREDALLQQFERQRVDGLLVSPVGEHLDKLRALVKRGLPVVLVDRGADNRAFPSVSVDDARGGALAVEHLIAGGRTSIAVVGGQVRIQQVAERVRGAQQAAFAAPGVGIQHIPTDGLTLDDGRVAGEQMASRIRAGEIDAVFAVNDLVAIGLQQSLLGGPSPVVIPRDVALVGYDDISFASAAVVPITSVRQPRDDIGRTAVRLLLELMEDPSAARQVVFEPELVVRASSAPASR